MSTLFKSMVSLALALAISLSASSGASADRRVALVIGNVKYQYAGLLPNTVNDANAIADLLKGVGFDVVDQRSDLGVDDFRQAVQQFIQLSFDADVAVIYFSGYGSVIDGVNYLVPVDSTLSSAREVEDQAISLNWVLVAAGGARKLSLIILDVGGENPVPPTNEDARSAGGVSLGLADVTLAVPNTLTAVAANASSASYGGDPNSPFMSALVKYIAQPGLDIRLALGKVHDEVLRATGNRQEPRIYGTLYGEEVDLVPAIPEARVAPAEATPAARLDEDLDYRIAQRIGSLEGWSSFLAAHASGFHAQAARAEVDRLALAEKAPSPTASEVSNGASSDGEAAEEATGSPPSPGRDVKALAPVDTCKRDEDRLAQLHASPSSVEVARFANELGCARLRPQLARLMENVEHAAPSPADVEAPVGGASSNGGTDEEIAHLGPPSQRTEAAILGPDEICKRDEDRLAQLRAGPSSVEVARFANELGCAKLRPQLARLIESLEYAAPAQAALEASNAHAFSNASAAEEIVFPPSPLPRTAVSALTSDEICKRDGVRLERLRSSPSSEQAARFANELGCEKLRPQLLRLIESLDDSATAPVARPPRTPVMDGSAPRASAFPPILWTLSPSQPIVFERASNLGDGTSIGALGRGDPPGSASSSGFGGINAGASTSGAASVGVATGASTSSTATVGVASSGSTSTDSSSAAAAAGASTSSAGGVAAHGTTSSGSTGGSSSSGATGHSSSHGSPSSGATGGSGSGASGGGASGGSSSSAASSGHASGGATGGAATGGSSSSGASSGHASSGAAGGGSTGGSSSGGGSAGGGATGGGASGHGH